MARKKEPEQPESQAEPEAPASEPEPEPAPEPPKKLGISDDELEEFEIYAREQEEQAGPHRPEISLQAAIVLLLIENVREHRGTRHPKRKSS